MKDSFGRTHDYLRISLTDKCNFRCTYCMPNELMKFMPDPYLLTSSEIQRLSEIFVDLGVKKIRLTGGEPTLRKDFNEIVKGLSALPVELSMTTNAFTLDKHIETCREFNLNKINISIDSVNQKVFSVITQRNTLSKVLENIDLALQNGLSVKLNAVIIRGENESQIIPLIKYAGERNMPVRFIEYMPFFGNEWEYKKVVSKREILELVSKEFDFQPIQGEISDTSKNYLTNSGFEFGIISTVTQNFCNGCNRIRLTADGKLKNCLFSSDEDNLKAALRSGEDVVKIIEENLFRKKKAAAGKISFAEEEAKMDYAKNRAMISIGG